MTSNKRNRVISFTSPAVIAASASAVGHEEKRGPYGQCFEFHDDTDKFGAKTWELAEGEMAHIALNLALKRRNVSHEAMDLLLAGDLQNQCVASCTGLQCFGIPYLGLYGACSTAVEGMLLASWLLSTRTVSRVGVVTSSHNCAAERQFRFPIEYGGQRSPTAQWTATAAGAFILEQKGEGIAITKGMAGKIVDGGITDATNMGAAMAPAACDSLLTYFSETGESPEDFDLIVTGDLGTEGSAILQKLCKDGDIPLGEKHFDCGAHLYNPSLQDVHAGASGCGCIAAMCASHFTRAMREQQYRRLLIMATGALMSPSSVQQGKSIFGIAPLVVWEAPK